ncbi:hypothetical protein JOQ06_005431, partial [Pogonophryne albipinna]
MMLHWLWPQEVYSVSSDVIKPALLTKAVLPDPLSVDLDQYDVVSLTDALRGFLQELPVPIIPAAVYSELVYTAQ